MFRAISDRIKHTALILAVTLSLSSITYANPVTENFDGFIGELFTWAKGNDTYGIWVKFVANPSKCPGGFYMPHESSNKQFVYASVLAAKLANKKVMIQVYDTSSQLIQNRCQIHYIKLY